MPANYDLPENGVVKRVRYFDGLFLKDQDFIDDQKYHTDRQRRPNLLLRVAGICEGLTVLVENNQVKVTPGSALDSHGRLIVLSETLSVDLKSQAGEVDIFISYQEEASDITQANNDKSTAGAPAAANSKGAKGATRWWENPRIEAILKTAKPTAEDTIWLGRVTVSGTTVQGKPNLEFRQYSGVYLPSGASSKNGPTLRSGGNVNPTLAVLTGDLNVTGKVGIGMPTSSGAKLEVTVDTNDASSKSLVVGKGTTNHLTILNSGNVGIGTTSPGQAFTVKGTHNSGKHEGSGMTNGGNFAIVSNAPQIDFIDTENNDWSIHVNANKMYFIRQPWEFKDLVLDGAGNVGIGTDTPAAKLAINGGLHVGGDSDPGDNNLLVDGNSTISGALSVTSTSTFTGNVGIGTDKPGAKLDINASALTAGGWYEAIRFSQSAHSAITHPGGGLLFGLHSDRNFYFADIKNGEFQKYVMQIEADTGNVGIGTTEPGSYKLNVQGNQYINSNLTIGGKIQSGMWRATHVFDRKAGPLPITEDFTTGGGTLVVLFTGTAFRANPGFINLVMFIDKQESTRMWTDLYTNEGNTHKTLPLQFTILSGISAGKHTLTIDKWGTSTQADANDRFYAMVLELPF
jgi:hypothetical protein